MSMLALERATPLATRAVVEAERLRDHLVKDHGRAEYELREMPLDAIHELEHFDDEHGLLVLDHRHAA
jgi:hypothetical protein